MEQQNYLYYYNTDISSVINTKTLQILLMYNTMKYC